MDDDRLIDTSDLQLEREILRAAADESTPSSVRRRALASLGLLVIAPTAAAASVGTSASATTSAVGKTIWWQAWLPKASLLLGLGGTAVGGAVAWERAQVNSPAVSGGAPVARTGGKTTQAVTELSLVPADAGSESMPVAPIQTALPRGAQAAPTPVSPEARSPAPARRLSATAPIGSTSTASASTEARGVASIREEINLLDRARTELRRGTPDAAMAIVNEYFARYPSGEFRAEAELVRREARRAKMSTPSAR